jgi:hypothetical protein
MPIQLGANFRLKVNTGTTGSPTWTVVQDMNSIDRGSSRDTSRFPVFDKPLPHSIPGAREVTFTVGGFLNTDDAGQEALRDAEQTDTPVEIQVLFDGTNGFTQTVRVGTVNFSTSPEGLQETGFEFSAQDAAVAVGTGPIL